MKPLLPAIIASVALHLVALSHVVVYGTAVPRSSNILFFASVSRQLNPQATTPPNENATAVTEPAEATSMGLAASDNPPTNEAGHSDPVATNPGHEESNSGQLDPVHSIYLRVDEVDQPAMPVGEWVINTQAWPPHTTTRVIVKVWISAKGQIDKWELVDASASDPFALEGFKSIKETILNPAWLNGVPVASFRLLEMDIERD